MKTRFAVLLLSGVLLPGRAYAQQAEFDSFRKAASYQSVLYRGHAPRSYSSVLYNGTYFWQTTEFLPGSVTFNGKHYTNVLLNIDAFAQELLVKSAPGAPAVVLNRSKVTELEIDGRQFVNLELAGQEGALPGFYCVACGNPLIYQRIDKYYASSTDNVNGQAIGYEDPNYRTDVLNYFNMYQRFFVVKDGRLKKIGKRKAFKLMAK